MKIIADPNIPRVREWFAPHGEVLLIPGRQITRDLVRDADVLLVRSVTPVNEALLEGSRVRFVATATIGTDHVDTAYLAANNIGFASAAGSNANSVAEYVVAALLEWSYRTSQPLAGRTLGVVGVGNVGSRVVRYAKALGMRVLPNDPPRQQREHLPDFVSLKTVLTEADIVTLHVPLQDDTRYLLHAGNLERFVVINTARGAVVNNTALVTALRSGKIPAAILDVWENEPNIDQDLLAAVMLGTPHIAGYSHEGKLAGTQMVYEAFCRYFGLPAAAPVDEPKPTGSVLEVACDPRETVEWQLRALVRTFYDIAADDAALRQAPTQFDALRARYPVRHEFWTRPVRWRGASAPAQEIARALRFHLVT
ncbi:MAG: 4-phosphoerythronate dehydrogenase [Verrucomicrobiae bacterium]|nr:4-phosphoerythronate dehydrogenase [Verrucomicrobiae bacterium]